MTAEVRHSILLVSRGVNKNGWLMSTLLGRSQWLIKRKNIVFVLIERRFDTTTEDKIHGVSSGRLLAKRNWCTPVDTIDRNVWLIFLVHLSNLFVSQLGLARRTGPPQTVTFVKWRWLFLSNFDRRHKLMLVVVIINNVRVENVRLWGKDIRLSLEKKSGSNRWTTVVRPIVAPGVPPIPFAGLCLCDLAG